MTRGEPAATPTNFNGLVEQLAAREFSVANVVSGDPGCSDQALVPMAIAFEVSGGGLDGSIQARVYRFKNDESYQKLRASVDTCAAEWISNPATLLMVDASLRARDRGCTCGGGGGCDSCRGARGGWRVGLGLFSARARRSTVAAWDCYRGGTLHERRLD